MFKAAWKSLLGRKVRLLMSAMAVVLGVAFVAGSFIFTDMLNGAFNGIVNGTYADVNVQPKGQGDGEGLTGSVTKEITPDVVAKVKAVDGVASAEGSIAAQGAYLIGKNGKVLASQGAPALGMNWVHGKAFGGQEGLVVKSGRIPQAWGEVAIDPASLEKSGYQLGDTMKIATTGKDGTISAKIVGTGIWGASGSTAGATYALFDTASAQRLFLGGKDVYQSVWVVAKPGADLDQVKDRVSAVLPADLEAVRGDVVAKQTTDAIAGQTKFITYFLLVFAAIALLVGTFLIVNTFSILVAQRSRELALLRALGASRSQVRRSVLFEAFVVGLVGSTLGLLLGIGIALGISAMFEAIGLDLGGTAISLAPRTIVVSYLVGMIVTMLAAYIPARRASSVPPVAAMTGDMMTGKAGLGRRVVLGTSLVVVGLAVLFGGLFLDDVPGGNLWWVGLGALLTLLGVTSVSPILGRPLTALLGGIYGAVFGTVGRLAHLNADRNPRRTAATASALMIGLAVVTAMTIAGQSMKASTHDAIVGDLRSDYLTSGVGFQGFSSSVADKMKSVDGVAEVHRMRFVNAKVDGENQGFNAIDEAGFDKIIAMRVVDGSKDAWKQGSIFITKTIAEASDLQVGKKVVVDVNGTKQDMTVGALLDDKTGIPGLYTPIEGLKGQTGNLTDNIVAVTKSPGTDSATLRTALEKTVADMPMVTVTDQEEFAKTQTSGIDQMLAIIYGLLALAIIIAVLGIINTLALSVIERTREIGLLRAIGLSRPQLRRMVRLESVVIALLGSVLGIGMGLLFGVALQRALADTGLDQLVIPWALLAAFVVVAIVIGVLAALYPASRAARLDVLRAIQTE